MQILVTGSKGFIGRNICLELFNRGFKVLEYDQSNSDDELRSYVNNADFIMHLAGINRPLSVHEYYDGNANFTNRLIDLIRISGRKIPVLFSSTVQTLLDNDYGKSKKIAEESLYSFSKETGNPVYIFHLSNVFGKWSRPNYNSVIATFCYNVSRDLEITISNPDTEISFVYIDDVVNSFINMVSKELSYVIGKPIIVEPIYRIKLGYLAMLIKSFKDGRLSLSLPNLADGFERKLYATYLSYLDSSDFSYPLSTREDNRGSFTEFIKTSSDGQISINIAKPGETKGNHWHHTKTEKFLVVSGEANIKLRRVDTDRVVNYFVTGKKLEVVDIPCGYTHSITNTGNTDLVTVMWASELFDPQKPDTFFLEVEKHG